MASSSEGGLTDSSVVETVEKLRAQTEPKDVIKGLRLLREVLLRHGGNNSFDPSNVFLAIQSSSLRFDKKSSTNQQEPTSRSRRNSKTHISYEERWSLLQEAMWSMAALTRLCVGPAWWYQALQRRRFRFPRTNRTNTIANQRHPQQHLRQTTPTTIPDDSSYNVDDDASSSGNSGKQEEQEIMEHSANSALRLNQQAPVLSYPPVPETLPPAILRFAANAIEKVCRIESKIPKHIPMASKMNLVEAQLSILQHLCCAHTMDYDRGAFIQEDWNIPEGFGLVGLVLAFGLKLVCTGRSEMTSTAKGQKHLKGSMDLLSFVVIDEDICSQQHAEGTMTSRRAKSKAKNNKTIVSLPPVVKDQWKYILLVARATTDLLSSGWRPLPRGKEGHDVVLSLLVIASRGTKLQDLQASREDTSTSAREERLVATSCAAEALSALLSFTTRGLIPSSLQRTLVRTVCRLHSQLGATTGDNGSNLLYPLLGDNDCLPNSSRSVGEEDEIDHQVAFFASQRELCLTDASDVLWAMLSNEASVEQASDVVFSIIEAATRVLGNKDSKDSPLFNKLKWNDQTGDYFLSDCATVLRVLSGALWGMAPDFAEIDLLRIFLYDAIRASCKLLSTIHLEFNASHETKKDKKARSGGPVIRSNYFNKQVRPLVVEAISALQRAVDAELRTGDTILSVAEWEALVDGIEKAIIPWLQEKGKSESGAAGAGTNVIRTDTESLLLSLAELLDHCVNVESAPLMEYPCQRRLFLNMLHSSDALENTNAETVGLSVVRAWTMFGFFPYRLEGWCDTACEVLEEVFSRSERGFMHPPTVRVEALKMLTFEDASDEVVNTESGEFSPRSLLVMTQQVMPELYLEVVAKGLFPVLQLVLAGDTSCGINPNTAAIVENSNSANEKNDEAKRSSDSLNESACRCGEAQMTSRQLIIEDELELQFFAVTLAGRLFMDGLIDREQRSGCVVMLKCAAVAGSYSESGDESAATTSVRLEALHQLELCLNEIFSSLPLAHESTPLAVNAICQILVTATESLVRCDGVEGANLLATSALQILGRLHLKPNNTVGFLPRANMSQQKDTKRADADLLQPARAVFGPNMTSEFNSVSHALFEVLRKTTHGTSEKNEGTGAMLSSLRREFFCLLTSILTEGVIVEVPKDLHEIFGVDGNVAPSVDSKEDSARLQALACIVEQMVALNIVRNGTVVSLNKVGTDPIGLLSRSCQGDDLDLTRGCRVLLVLAPSIENAAATFVGKEAESSLFQRLEVESSRLSSSSERPLPIVFLLAALCEIQPGLEASADHVAMRTFECCIKVVTTTYLATKSLALHMALRCSLASIKKLTSDEAKTALQYFTTFCREEDSKAPQPACCEEEHFAPSVICENLEQRHKSSFALEPNAPAGLLSVSRYHALTIECDNLDSFPVEEEGRGLVSPRAAWLFGNNIVLVCRLGSSTSRCRGYLEVVLRTPLMRKRILLLIPGAAALEDPEFPCLLKYGPKTPSAPNQGTDIVDQDTNNTPGQVDIIKTDSDSTEVLDQARSVLERFDAMFSPGIENLSALPLDGEDDASLDQALTDDDVSSTTLPDGSSLLSSAGDSTVLTTSTTAEAPFEPYPAESLPEQSTPAQVLATADPSENTLQDWLVSIFGWDNAGNANLQHQLENYLQPHAFALSNLNGCFTFGSYDLHKNNCKQLQYDAKLERAICILDRTAPSNTYKFSLLYLGLHQNTKEGVSAEAQLLGTTHCSPAFYNFAKQLGEMTPTRHLRHYSAGLDTSEYESDGRYAIAWLAPDETDAVVFHVSSLMPEGINGRKRHIGNDNVLIVFVDESSGFRVATNQTYADPLVSGHFNFVTLFVSLLPPAGLFRASCRVRAGLAVEIDALLSQFAGDHVLPEASVAHFVRGLAMKIDVACRTILDGLPPPTNCLERARQIHEMKRYEM